MSAMRVFRYAPSPTGHLHLGGLRTALFAFLAARRSTNLRNSTNPSTSASQASERGLFLLRIEDTDTAREVPGAAQQLCDDLEWAGIDWDFPPRDSPAGRRSLKDPSSRKVRDPRVVVQSERTDVYALAAEALLARGAAYRCFCTPERLQTLRGGISVNVKGGKNVNQSASLSGISSIGNGVSQRYDRLCASLPRDEAERRAKAGEPHVIRLFVPSGSTGFVDLVRGRTEYRHDHIDDQVLLKSDGFPTYHLANVVDDHDCAVTHVVRGEEWVASTPKHILLYKALGWGDKIPAFAHLPLLTNPDGTKLSKRQGDVAVQDYREKGYLSQALVNHVAMLGWTPPGDRELYFNLEEMAQDFDLARVHRGAAVFNVQKLNWFNAQHLRRTVAGGSDEDLNELVIQLTRALEKQTELFASLPDEGQEPAYLRSVIRCISDRISLISDIPELCSYFWRDPDHATSPQIQEKSFKKLWQSNGASRSVLERFAGDVLEPLAASDEWSADALNDRAHDWCNANELKLPQLWKPLRFAVTGTDVGAGIPQTLQTLGAPTAIRRIKSALAKLP